MSADIETAVQELLKVVSFESNDERLAVHEKVRTLTRTVAEMIRIMHEIEGVKVTNRRRLQIATHLCVYIVQLEAGLYVVKNKEQLKERALDRDIALETFCQVMSQGIRRLSVDTIAELMKEGDDAH